MNIGVVKLLLRPAPGNNGVVVLPTVAFMIVTALILTVVGGAQTFWTWRDEMAGTYQALAAIALVLLVIPLTTLGGAAARLSAKRRDERLSTLRLLGVTPSGVGVIAVAESAAVAVAGALTGILPYLAMVPLVGLIPFRGSALGAGGVLLPAPIVAVIAIAVVLLAVVSAVIGLRRVVISPLGVRMRATGAGAHWSRAVIAVIVLFAAFMTSLLVPGLQSVIVMIVVCVGMFGGALLVLGVLGPWVLKVRAQRQARRAQDPVRLLSARSVLNDPKAAWRQVSGVAMASFLAVFAGSGVSLMSMLSSSDASADQQLLGDDMRTGLIITLVATFLMVSSSIGVNQAADILDSRDLHHSLHYLGVPEATVDAARRRAIMSPLLTTTVGAALCAFALIFPIIGLAVVTAPVSMLTIAVVLAAGIALVWLSGRVTSPLLSRAFTDSAPSRQLSAVD